MEGKPVRIRRGPATVSDERSPTAAAFRSKPLELDGQRGEGG
jgi:hypothetical protein